MRKSEFVLAVVALVASVACNANVGRNTAEQQSTLTETAQMAQQRCHEFMHEDADKFVSCIDAIERTVDRRAALSDVRRFGIVYFARVAAQNSARVALPGADVAVTHYFVRMRRLQRQIGIGEALLCRSVPGDCAARLALIAQSDVKVFKGAQSK